MKKSLCLLLAISLIVPMLALTVPTPVRADGAITVHAYVPVGWADPCIYSWPTGGVGDISWPGSAMTHEDGQWYVSQIPDHEDNVVINGDGGSRQTIDTHIGSSHKEVWVVIGDTPVGYTDNHFNTGVYYEKPDDDLVVEPEPEPEPDDDPYGIDPFQIPQSLAIVGSGIPGVAEWFPADEAGDMELVGDLLYRKELSLPAGTTMTFKFVGDNEWNDYCNLGSGEPVIGGDTDLVNSSFSTDMYLSVSRGTILRFTVDLSALAAGTGPATLSIQPVDTRTDTFTVHAKIPNSWGTEPRCWAWRMSDNANVFTAWPGELMTLRDGWYTIQVPTWADGIIINDGSTTQTYDLKIDPCEDVWLVIQSFDDISITYQEPTEQFTAPDSLAIVGIGIPGVSEWDPADPQGDMEEISSLVYEKELRFPEQTTMWFKFAANDVWDYAFDLGCAAPVIGGKADLINGQDAPDTTLEIRGGTTLRFTVDLTPLARGIGPATLTIEEVKDQTVTVYAQIPDTWGTMPHCWAWQDSTMLQAFEAWPGEPMRMEDGWYCIQIPTWCDRIILNDGGSTQTIDLQIDPGKDIWMIARSFDDVAIHYEDPTDLVTCFVRFPAHWQGTPHCWTWNSTTQQAASTWPGTSMEPIDDQWYVVQFPDWVDRAVFSDENGLSSEDIVLVTDPIIWIDILSATDHALYPTDPGELFTVHAHVPADWSSTVYCQTTDADGQPWFLDPSGKQMTHQDGWYHVQVPSATYEVLFSDGTDSSSTLSVTPGREVWIWFADTSDYTISQQGPTPPDDPDTDSPDPSVPTQSTPSQRDEDEEDAQEETGPSLMPILVVALISIAVLAAAAVAIVLILKKR